MAIATWVVDAFPAGARVFQRSREVTTYLYPATELSPYKVPLGIGSWHEGDHGQGI